MKINLLLPSLYASLVRIIRDEAPQMGSIDSQGDTFFCHLIQNLRNKRGEGGTFCLHVANGERTIISIFTDLALGGNGG